MAYAVFERKLTRRVGPPTVSVTPTTGRLGFNKAAAELLSRDAIDHVLLLWDEQANKFAVRPIKKKDARSFRITFNRNGASANISAKSFCHHIGYAEGETERYPAEWNDSENALEVDLSQTSDEAEASKEKKFEVHRRQHRSA